MGTETRTGFSSSFKVVQGMVEVQRDGAKSDDPATFQRRHDVSGRT